MVENKKLLTEDAAQEIAEKFLLSKHFDAKVDFCDAQLITKDKTSLYRLQGKLAIPSRSLLERFVSDKNANRYSFRIEVDAHQGYVTNYELT